jgi:hypothetical protein
VPATVISDTGSHDNGINLRATDLGSVNNSMLLEEAFVDANGTAALLVNFTGAGALIGAFTPAATVNNIDFEARNDKNVRGGISAQSLFLVGTGPVSFSALGPGTLFFGISDPRAENNLGSFTETVVPVPPAPHHLGTALLLLALRSLNGVCNASLLNWALTHRPTRSR